MKRKKTFVSCALFILCTALCLADRQLNRTEILNLFEHLTNQPKDTWISSGTIEGYHEEKKRIYEGAG